MNYSEDDIEILARDELSRIPECINALANSSGGIIKVEGGNDIPVEPLEWYEKPAVLDGKVWRRIEGINIISGMWARSVMASRDSCDDFPADNSHLHDDDIDSFRKIVFRLHPELTEFTHDEFMRRTGIFSGKHITSAGALMFGETLNISAELLHKDIHTKIESYNIWEAYTNILPRITRNLLDKSAESVRNALINALLHSEYILDTHINIQILSSPARVVIDSPGIITQSIRNHRLTRIAALAGISADTLHAEHDMLNFRTISTILINGVTPIVL